MSPWTSGHDGGICRHASPSRTATKRISTNLKTKNNQNCQNIELDGSLTTKDLKKKYSSRWVDGAEIGSWDGQDTVWWQWGSGGGRWQNRQSHFHVWPIKTREDTWGVSDPSPRPDSRAGSSSDGKIKPHNFWLLKTSGCWGRVRNCQSPRRVHSKGPQCPGIYANPPTLGTTTRATARGVSVIPH